MDSSAFSPAGDFAPPLRMMREKRFVDSPSAAAASVAGPAHDGALGAFGGEVLRVKTPLDAAPDPMLTSVVLVQDGPLPAGELDVPVFEPAPNPTSPLLPLEHELELDCGATAVSPLPPVVPWPLEEHAAPPPAVVNVNVLGPDRPFEAGSHALTFTHRATTH